MLKKCLAVIAALALCLLSSCGGEKENVAEEKEKSQEAVTDLFEIHLMPLEEKAELLNVSQDELLKYGERFYEILSDNKYFASWNGDKIPSGESVRFSSCNVEKSGEYIDITYLVTDSIFTDPETLKERRDHGVPILKEGPDGNFYDTIPVGTAKVKLSEDNLTFISGSYKKIDEPGLTVLKERNEEKKEEIEKSPLLSEKFPDMDGLTRDGIYYKALEKRFIENKDDLRLWDLENLTDLALDYRYYGMEPEDVNMPSDGFFDAEAVRYMKKLKNFFSIFNLKDYSVFDGMDLESLNIRADAGIDKTIETLKFKSVENLSITDFNEDIVIDLKGAEVKHLTISSWTSGVKEFKGCENVEALEILSTRTDMRLINAENFPGIKNISFNIYSDNPRRRDFSKLSTFPEDVGIVMVLSYQAANNSTVRSLDGVRLDMLELHPNEGPYPLGEPDKALVDKINVPKENVIWVTER